MAVFPRPMRFRGRAIRAGVLSTVMVDPRRWGEGIGRRLMERAFAGPQDLFYTDGANEASRRPWVAAGGEVCLVSSCQWARVLRPGAWLLERAGARKGLRLAARALRPLAAPADAAAVRAPVGPYRLRRPATVGEGADEAALLALIEGSGERGALAPVYDRSSLGWLLRQAEGATRRGTLERTIVRGSGGAALGWYVAFVKPGGVSQVVQLGGAPGTVGGVLDHLFHRCLRRGSPAVTGQLEPAYVEALAAARCSFSFGDLGVLVHARDESITRAIHAGDHTLSRLDGEWWMRFADGPWD